MFLISSCTCLCPIHWSQVLSWEWRWSWSSTNRWCSNYIWVINNFIASVGATYIRGIIVCYNTHRGHRWRRLQPTADVINHNGRKIGRFKPIWFCDARMTSAQSRSQRHHWFEPTSSLPIFKGLYLVIYKTLALIFPVQVRECEELYLCKNPSRNMHVYPAK